MQNGQICRNQRQGSFTAFPTGFKFVKREMIISDQNMRNDGKLRKMGAQRLACKRCS